MINDGYGRRIVLKDLGLTYGVFYRPATRSERDWMTYTCHSMDKASAAREVFNWTRSHLSRVPFGACLEDFNDAHPTLFGTLFKAILGHVPDSSGKLWFKEEIEWASNLRDGVMLSKLNPKLAQRSCELCQKLWYNEKTGEPHLVNSTMQPMPREGPTPCQTEDGCLKGTPDKQRTLIRQNRLAVQHYKECVAVGSFPDDAIVRANAVIIRDALSRKASK